VSYPIPGGKIIGRPYQGSHKPGATTPANWQSDNAVDIAAPVGTPVYAVGSGVIGPNIGPFSSSSPYLAGQRLTVQLPGGNAAYYAHLSRIVVHAGQRVHEGELLGYSGSANGVAHLHFAVEKGTPFAFLANLPGAIAKGVGLGPSSSTSSNSDGAANDALAAAAGPAMGCATLLVRFTLVVGACVAIVWGTGAPIWP
jgi:murein DD-endopeptidase MepM/ murein hydrolase activator NlpD